MRKLTLVVVMVLTIVAVGCSQETPTSPEAARGASPSPSGLDARFSHISVTTLIESVEGGAISSDGRGAYSHNVEGVQSILTENGYNGIQYGDWQFNTLNSTVRGVGHTFDAADAVQPGDPIFLVAANPPYWGTQILKQKNLAVKCTLFNRSMLTMSAGSSFTCPLLNAFVAANGTEYGLHAASSFTGFPETTDAQILCNAADSGGCRDWSIEPIGQAPAVARLTREASKPNKPSIHEGTFYLRFRIHITRS